MRNGGLLIDHVVDELAPVGDELVDRLHDCDRFDEEYFGVSHL